MAAGAAAAHLRSKQALMELLRARVLDKGAYVRQRALQVGGAALHRCTSRSLPLALHFAQPDVVRQLIPQSMQTPQVWTHLIIEKCVPLSWWNVVVGLGECAWRMCERGSRQCDGAVLLLQWVTRAALRQLYATNHHQPPDATHNTYKKHTAVGRLEDESQLVIRAALRLLYASINNNPFSPGLVTDRFAATLAKLEGQLEELGPERRSAGDSDDEGGEGGADGGDSKVCDCVMVC